MEQVPSQSFAEDDLEIPDELHFIHEEQEDFDEKLSSEIEQKMHEKVITVKGGPIILG